MKWAELDPKRRAEVRQFCKDAAPNGKACSRPCEGCRFAAPQRNEQT